MEWKCVFVFPRGIKNLAILLAFTVGTEYLTSIRHAFPFSPHRWLPATLSVRKNPTKTENLENARRSQLFSCSVLRGKVEFCVANLVFAVAEKEIPNPIRKRRSWTNHYQEVVN